MSEVHHTAKDDCCLLTASARLRRVIQRAAERGVMTLGVIGGSITEGASASAPGKRWANLHADWWRERFGVEVRLVNAGRGATGSLLGAHRARGDLLVHTPDIVVIECAVNDDATDPVTGPAFEGLIRQILSERQAPAVLVLTTIARDGRTAQNVHAAIAAHYGLPLVSYADAVRSKCGTNAWDDIGADAVHPNDTGHALISDLLKAAIERVVGSSGPDTSTRLCNASTVSLPPALHDGPFTSSMLVDPKHLDVKNATGWELTQTGPFGGAWRTNTPGSVLSFDTPPCSSVGIVYRQFKGPQGRVVVALDGLPVKTPDGWFAAIWGERNAAALLARGLSLKIHRVCVELASERASESTGHSFELRALLCAGTDEIEPVLTDKVA